MEIIQTEIEGVFVIKPTIYLDARGYFFESFSKRDFEKAVGHEVNFVQDNQSKSVRGVIRGLHFQRPPMSQAKLVRCIHGDILDVAVDLRKNSPTFGKHVSVRLSSDSCSSIYIPHGFAHGFAVLSDEAIIQYKCDNYYSKVDEGGIYAFDKTLNIDWGLPKDRAILSEKDKELPSLIDFTKNA